MFVNCSRCGEHGLAWIKRNDRRLKFIEKEVVCICIINEMYLYAGDEYGENGQVNDVCACENGGVAECYIGRFGDFGGCGNYRVSEDSWCVISEKHYN
jgi:hypothetical protein